MNSHLIPSERIERKIFSIRGRKVMMDNDLADLYGVRTKELNKAVKRNIERFPKDFMFLLTGAEMRFLRFQIGTSKIGSGGRRYLPYAFTEHGILMLSSVLNSKRAIQINVQIMRTFIKLRELLLSHRALKEKIEEIEKKYDHQFLVVFDAIKRLLQLPKEVSPKVRGFSK